MENQNQPETTAPAPKKPTLRERFNAAPPAVRSALIALPVLLAVSLAWYAYAITQRVYTDNAEITAPLIQLSPSQPAVLEKVLVSDGDRVSADEPVARLQGGGFVWAKTNGVVVATDNRVGALFAPGTPVVTMIDPSALRLVAHVPENKGLDKIAVGQKVTFTVDAFGSREFTGTVEEIAASADQSSVVFSISDTRDEKDFSVKIKYDNYPELMNGMSAKAWIYQ